MRVKVQEVEVITGMDERTRFGSICRPRWKEYTLIKYVGRKAVVKEKVWVDESYLFGVNEEVIRKKRKKVA